MSLGQNPTVLVLPDDWPDDAMTLAEFAAALEDRVPELDVRVGSDYADALSRIETADVVLSRYIPGEMLDAAGNLKWIQSTSAGVDQYDLERLEAEGIVLTSASGVHAEPIAEQVLAYMLAFERNLHVGFRRQRKRRWEHYPGGELKGKTVGILGVGAIGGRVADLAGALGMTVVGTKRDPSEAPEAVDEIYGPDGLHAVLGRSDYVVVACPLTEETRGMLTIKEFANSMKGTAVLVNIARGEIVDERHLAIAVGNGDIGGAAIDVADTEPLPEDSPLWNLENVIVTPHMAGSTPKYLERIADLFCENYRRFVEDGPDALKNRML